MMLLESSRVASFGDCPFGTSKVEIASPEKINGEEGEQPADALHLTWIVTSWVDDDVDGRLIEVPEEASEIAFACPESIWYNTS